MTVLVSATIAVLLWVCVIIRIMLKEGRGGVKKGLGVVRSRSRMG